MGRLDGKVAIISGGARGQGEVEAKLFAQEGAKVVFGDILDEQGKQIEAAIRQAGGAATYVHLDVTREADWQQAVATAVSTYGKLDILVNNAGILRRDSIEETTKELWDTILAVNATGVFLGTKYVIPEMRKAGGGSIVNISSISGMIALGGPAYNASKGAVRVFTKVTAVHHAGDNIRCNSIHPGPVRTPMTESTYSDPEMLAQRLQSMPLGRIGTSEDIAYGVLYLASDEAAYMTGAELVIDGGYTAQ